MKLDPPHFWLLALAICFGIISLVLLLPIGHAMTLQISSCSTGQGAHNLTFWGEHLNTTLQKGNNSTRMINAMGAGA
jgi:hypothetical protein